MRTVRVLTIADIHYCFSKAELVIIKEANRDCDACFLLGDIPISELRIVKELVKLPMCGVLGNHDVHGMLKQEGIPDCSFSALNIAGLKVAGFPGSPRYNNEHGRVMYTQEEASSLSEELIACTDRIDVLLSHSATYDKQADVAHSGFKAIDKFLDKHYPSVMLHGHDHESKRSEYRSLGLLLHGRASVSVVGTFRVEKHKLKIR